MAGRDSPPLRERLILAIGGYSRLLTWYRARRPRWLWRMVSPYGRPTSRYVAEHGLTVRHGPFAGTRFPEASLGHTNYLGAKLLGTYEPPVVRFLSEHASESDLFVDFGGGDGFFCVGLARNVKSLRTISYELNPHERKLSHEIASENDVAIETRERASLEELADLPGGRLLLLCDLEGLEEEILDPEAAPRLRDATIAVEAHEQFRPGVIRLLTARFEPTHSVTWSGAASADPAAIHELAGWDPESSGLAVYDGHRPGEGWLFMVPLPGSAK